MEEVDIKDIIRDDSEIMKMTASEEFKEKFYKNRDWYDKSMLLNSLSEEDKEVLRRGRELLEMKNNTIWKRIKRFLFNRKR